MYFYDGKTGDQKFQVENSDVTYNKFVNNNELIGYKFDYEENKTKIFKYHVGNKEQNQVVTMDKYYYSLVFDNNGKAASIEQDNILYYYDVAGRAEKPVEILKGYDYIRIRNINHDYTSVLYNEEGKSFFALYEKTKLLFRKRYDMGYSNRAEFIGTNDLKQIIYVEDNYSNKVGLGSLTLNLEHSHS